MQLLDALSQGATALHKPLGMAPGALACLTEP